MALLLTLGGIVVGAWGLSIPSVGIILAGVLTFALGLWIYYGKAIRARLRARKEARSVDEQKRRGG